MAASHKPVGHVAQRSAAPAADLYPKVSCFFFSKKKTLLRSLVSRAVRWWIGN
jgi:hypothetical protein